MFFILRYDPTLFFATPRPTPFLFLSPFLFLGAFSTKTLQSSTTFLRDFLFPLFHGHPPSVNPELTSSLSWLREGIFTTPNHPPLFFVGVLFHTPFSLLKPPLGSFTFRSHLTFFADSGLQNLRIFPILLFAGSIRCIWSGQFFDLFFFVPWWIPDTVI